MVSPHTSMPSDQQFGDLPELCFAFNFSHTSLHTPNLNKYNYHLSTSWIKMQQISQTHIEPNDQRVFRKKKFVQTVVSLASSKHLHFFSQIRWQTTCLNPTPSNKSEPQSLCCHLWNVFGVLWNLQSTACSLSVTWWNRCDSQLQMVTDKHTLATHSSAI